jgi:hypothetical protein
MNIQQKKLAVIVAIDELVADETDDKKSTLRLRSLEEIQSHAERAHEKLWQELLKQHS